MTVRYAYGVTAALLLGGSALALTSPPVGAQSAQPAQNDESFLAQAPRPGAPMSFADLTEKLQPAVVNIATKQTVESGPNPLAEMMGLPDGGGPQEGQATGSGFLISADGYIVTNAHVVSPASRGAKVESVTVTLADRKEYTARVIGADRQSDLAVLKIDATGLPFVKLGDSRNTRVGDWVVAIGNPFGLSGTVTAGIVSALDRVTGQGGPYDRFIQTDASINRGNSGGPMFNLNGEVIGINSQIFSPTGGNVGIGFAIPADEAKPIIDSIIAGRPIERGYLGVGMQDLDEDMAESMGIEKNRGTMVSSVEPGQPAAKAGIQRGDIIISVGGKPITPISTLAGMIAAQKPGARVPIELVRGGKTMTVTATLGQRPTDDEFAARFGDGDGEQGAGPQQPTVPKTGAGGSLGIALQPISPQHSRQYGLRGDVSGLVVAGLAPGSDAARKGLQPGDIIVTINGQPVSDVKNADAIVGEAVRAGRSNVTVLVQRGSQQLRYIALRLSKD